MERFVLDSSVILAVLRDEPGGDVAARFALGATMSSVNVAEVVTKCVELELPADAAVSFILARNINVADFDHRLAVVTGHLQKAASKGTLSLGDRACIATAARLGGTAVTTDRIWAELDLPCPVELIR